MDLSRRLKPNHLKLIDEIAKKQKLQLGLLEGDRQLALADRAQARQNIADARQARREGAMGIVGGLTNIGIAAATGGLGGAATGGDTGPVNFQTETTEELIKQGLASPVTQDAFLSVQRPISQDFPQFNPIPDIMFRKEGGRVKYGHGGKMNEDVIIAILEEGGMNAPVTKLEGEFNHSTNKKAIIDEETGIKEAEATGGEYILNPEQGEEISMAYKGIEQIVDSGEEPTMDQLMALYEAVRNVFSQPQFNEA